MMYYRRRNPGGFSLAEAMMATVVLAIAAAGVLLPITSGAAVRTEGERQTLAAKLGSDMLERIMRTDPDKIVAAYDGYIENEGSVTDSSGSVFTDSHYAKFSRSVSCEYVHVSQQVDQSTQMFVAIVVRVYYAGREMAVIRRLVTV